MKHYEDTIDDGYICMVTMVGQQNDVKWCNLYIHAYLYKYTHEFTEFTHTYITYEQKWPNKRIK